MKRKSILLMILCLISVIALVSCTEQQTEKAAKEEVLQEVSKKDNIEEEQNENNINQEQKESEENFDYSAQIKKSNIGLAGLHLGDSEQEVEKLLGKNFSENYLEEGGYFGEPLFVREYDSGIRLIIGKNSKKVLSIEVFKSTFPTELGIKVGDNSQDVLQTYRKKYEEFEGMYSNGRIQGWFMVEKHIFLIFDFDLNDQNRINERMTSSSKVEEIVLVYSWAFE